MRPSRAESRELEALECASARVAHAQETAAIVALRFRQVERRAPGLSELTRTGQAQITQMVDALDEAHELLAQVLNEKHQVRSQAHFETLQEAV